MLGRLAFIFILLFSVVTALPARAEPMPDPMPSPPPPPAEHLSAGLVGWGNLLVPGLGATVRDEPLLGLQEAVLEIGTFYGGTLLAPEKRFRIDGSIDLPYSGNINNAVLAQTMQQFGLKYHFYNTFLHYQETAKENADLPSERDNPQPLDTRTAGEMFASPFKVSNLESPWVWPAILGGSAALLIMYKTESLNRQPLSLTPSGEALLGVSQGAVVPIGSYMGEDPLFRGFIQRELIGLTGSATLAIGTQSALFCLLHEDHGTAFVAGVFLGISTLENGGDMGKAMAVHFWLDVVDGILTYLQTRAEAGEGAPLSPPVTAQVSIPLP